MSLRLEIEGPEAPKHGKGDSVISIIALEVGGCSDMFAETARLGLTCLVALAQSLVQRV